MCSPISFYSLISWYMWATCGLGDRIYLIFSTSTTIQTPSPPHRQCLEFLPLFCGVNKKGTQRQRDSESKRRSSTPAMPSSTPSTNGIMPEVKKAGKGCSHFLTYISLISAEHAHLCARTHSLLLRSVTCCQCITVCCFTFLIIWYWQINKYNFSIF